MKKIQPIYMRQSPVDKRRRQFLVLLGGFSALSALAGKVAHESSIYKDRLYTPTQIVKLFGTYFIVDCWHHRILYSTNILEPLEAWSVLDNNLAGPHSIASNGNFFITEDTGRHSVKVYQKKRNGFELVQTLSNVGKRPHRVVYDTHNKQFLIVGSTDQSIYFFIENQKKITYASHSIVKELKGQYCRSITIRNGHIYFVGVKDLVVYELDRFKLGKFLRIIKLNQEYFNCNDLYFKDSGEGYLTATPKKIFYFKSINELEIGQALDLSKSFKGTPYYISQFNQKIWIPEITEYSAISYLAENDASLNQRKHLFDFGLPNEASIQRKSQLPL